MGLTGHEYEMPVEPNSDLIYTETHMYACMYCELGKLDLSK